MCVHTASERTDSVPVMMLMDSPQKSGYRDMIIEDMTSLQHEIELDSSDYEQYLRESDGSAALQLE